MHAPLDGAMYLTSLPIHVTATDSEGVNDIDLMVDGKEVPLKTVKDGTGASVKFEWGGAKNLSYGPHTVVAVARDEAKNEGKAVAKVTHVGGGKYPYKVGTSYALKVGKVKGGKVKVRGKISPKGNLSRLAHGRAYVYFSRFDTKAKRWKKVSRYSRDAKHAFTLRYKFKKRGVWRVTGNFKPKKGFKASTRQGRARQASASASASRRSRRRAGRPRSACGRRGRPCASSASCLAAAVPAVPETMAPAWPIVLPGGAVKPAM